VVIIICGVTGVGKTTIGQLLAQELQWEFYDADDFHSVANIAKMEGGVPLTDEDRQPWLGKLRELVQRMPHCEKECCSRLFCAKEGLS
jgi:carbohydrate kinase (thermoresistant glucokinase family)